MRITIDTDILHKNGLSLGEYLVLLLGYFQINFNNYIDKLIHRKIASADLFALDDIILSDNAKSLITKIIIASDERLKDSPVKDWKSLAEHLQVLYPDGNKEGTTYSWRDTVDEIIYKLQVLVVKHHFIFTEQEAIDAVKEYRASFTDSYTHMQLLKYFILRTKKDGEIKSDFMTYIQNKRENG